MTRKRDTRLSRTLAHGDKAKLRSARALMADALAILDVVAPAMAAATLDLAIHQLDRELAR